MLFERFTLRCGQTLPNRIALAPLTNKQSHADGTLGDAELAFLAARADGGFGLIETCAAYVAQDGKGWAGQLAIDRDACVPGLTRLATRIHAAGAKLIVQLIHSGLRADPAVSGVPVWSASSTDQPAENRPSRVSSVADIERVLEEFTAAAARAKAAGLDGVELHAAHGYLLSQFLSRTMNRREDAWGGDAERRARLVREATRAVRARCGADFIVGVRLSLEDLGQARGLDLDESLQVARWLVDDGADFIHASLWDITRMTMKRPDMHALALLRAALPRDAAILTAGKISTREDAESALRLGADVVAIGRSAIANPAWPRMIERGEQPRRPPLTRAELAERAVSPVFQEFLTRWNDMVID